MEGEMKKIKFQIFFILLIFSFQFLRAEYFQIKVINDEKDLPEKFCSIWSKGDYLIATDKYYAIIGATNRRYYDSLNYPSGSAYGSVLSFVPAGEKLTSDICFGSPVIVLKEKRYYPSYDSFKPEEKNGNLEFKLISTFSKNGKKAFIKTNYIFYSDCGRIDIVSEIKNTGDSEFDELDYSLYFNAFHKYYFNPFDEELYPNLNFRVYQKKGYYIARINLNPYSEEPLPGKLSPGDSYEVKYIVLINEKIDELLKNIYEILNIKSFPVLINFKNYDGKLMEIKIEDVKSSSTFFKSFFENRYFVNTRLPEGAYKIIANFFPAVCEETITVRADAENSCIVEKPSFGTLKIKIENSNGEYEPGKVTFIGLYPTKTPYFEPENPLETKRYYESFKNSCFPPEEGLEIRIPVGTYLVYASRGPEYSIDTKIIEVLEKKYMELIFKIDKIIETPNLVSIDPHMHTLYSDGRVRTEERIKSVIAEGVEVAVATDHNYITDYSPVLKKLGMEKYLTVISGNEVSTSGVIHFNSYPLEPRTEQENNGAIDPVTEEASVLFKRSREKDPDAIIQVNHPRSGSLGYFNNYELDPEYALYAKKNFDTSFDILEIMNGPVIYGENYQSIKDWFNLLNKGYYFPAVGSSDSHVIDGGEPGYSRTYVFYEEEKELNIDKIIDSIKKGKSFVTNGPLIDLKVNEKYSFGDLLTDRDGKIDVEIKVMSAPWISVSEVRIIVNGERKIIFPVKGKEREIIKLNERISLNLERDSYIIGEVIGERTLYPVVQQPSGNGSIEEAVIPYAITNPVFVDIDGNGRFDPLFPQKIELVEFY